MSRTNLALLALAGLGALACNRSDSPAALAAAPPPGPPQASTDVVADVGGTRITLAEVDKRAAGRLARLRDEEYEARRQALEELIADKLVEREAAARGVSSEALLKKEVDGGVKKPTPAEIEAIYAMNKDRVQGRSLAEVTPQIESSVKAQRTAERRAAFHQELRKKAAVSVTLQQPRTAIAVPADAPSLGPADAKVTVVEFLDYQCPFCHRVQAVVDEILERYAGKVRFVHRDFPLYTIHPQAAGASKAAHCAGEQGKFWEFHRHLLMVPGDMSEKDLKERAAGLKLDPSKFGSCFSSTRYEKGIQETYDYGTEMGITGTPTFFVNGRRLSGVRPIEDFREIIDAELAAAR